MRMTSRRLFGAATLLALMTTGLLGGTASAKPGDTPVVTPVVDPRAVSHAKNLDWDHDNACVTAGLTGEARDGDGKTPTLPHTSTDTLLTITGGFEGYTVTGVVVKGGDAYNVYSAAKLGPLPWVDLRSPAHDNKGAAGQTPTRSHWFFCVEKVTQSTEPTKPETKPETKPNTPDDKKAVVPTTTTTTTTTAPAAPTTTTQAAAAPGAGELANTGFDGTWLLVLGLALVAAGAAFVASPKLRGLLRR